METKKRKKKEGRKERTSQDGQMDASLKMISGMQCCRHGDVVHARDCLSVTCSTLSQTIYCIMFFMFIFYFF